MNLPQRRKDIIFFKELTTSLILGIKFGIVGAVLGFILHFIWGNLEAISYTVITGFLIGFIVGLFELLFSHPKAGRLPYSLLLFIRTLIYFLITIVSVYVVFRIYLDDAGFTKEVLRNPQTYAEIEKVYFLANINTIYILVFTIVATFIWQLKSFFGKGVLLNYLTGRYHKPSHEDRIFMFLDLNDATTIAEKLGSKIYSSFLSDFFKDIDIAFTQTKGRIFQYVGDEVVVIWNLKTGLKNNNCIESYFLALNILEDKKEYYFNNYNTFPSFKASLHVGEVTITEIGVSKKEIVYHGDTMNTASRICASAHKLGKNILISKELHGKLKSDTDIVFDDLGEHLLKGKDEKIHLFSIGTKVESNR
jgi:adenylate cyclase